MAPSVKLHFFAANDINGSLLHEITDEDDYFKSLKLKVERDGLGGAELLLARTVGFSPFATGTFRAESFVRLIIPAYSSTTYYPWGFFLNKRQQVVVHVDEKGGEEFKLGGPGPKQYLARHALGIETQTSQAPTVDLENGVWRWNEHATVGRILNKILDEDAALNNPSLPDLTWTFDNIDDSDSVNWIDDDIAGPGEFEVPIGTDFLKVLWDLDDFVQLTSWVDLGTVASPKFELNVIQGLGDDNTGSAFGAGVCLLKEGENIADDAVTVEGASLRQASHVLVEGKDGVWVQAVRTGYSPGDYTKREKISFTRTSNEAWLEAVGKRWLDRQDNGEKEITIEIVPGQSDVAGSYFPAPDRVLWLSNLISVETAADGTSQTALDLDPADAQLVTGFELDTHQAADDSDSTAYARSWDVKVKLNVERSGNVQKTPDQRSTASGGGSCKCIQLCPSSYQVIATSTSWKRTTAPPAAGFHDVGFDDSAMSNAVANPQGGYYDPSSSRWIWANTNAQAGDGTELAFRREFEIVTAPTTARLLIAADNGAEVYINGTLVATHGLDERGAIDVSPFNYANPTTHVVDVGEFVVGTNAFSIIAWNENQPPNNSGPAAVYAVLTLDGVVSEDGDAARCEHGHLFEDLYTNETDTGLVAAPDGSGGLIWVEPATLGLSPTPVRVPELETHHRFVIVAHQGDINDTDGYPEGTLEALRQAVMRGAHWIDLDLRKSSDGTWHILHDATLDRTTNLTGNISSTTDAAILAGHIDGGNGYDAGRHGTSLNVPTLIDVINALKPYPCVFQFDCKILDDSTAAELAQIAVDEGIDSRVAFNLDTDPRRAIVAAISPNIFLGGPDYGTADWDSTSFDTFAEIAAIAPTWFIGVVDRADYPAADEAAILQTLWDRGARGITANDIPAVVAKLTELLHPDLGGSVSTTHWEPVIFDNAGTPEIVYFQNGAGVWDIVMHEVQN